MAFNFEKELNFSKSVNYNTQSALKKEMKRQRERNKEEEIYGDFYGDLNLEDDNQKEDGNGEQYNNIYDFMSKIETEGSARGQQNERSANSDKVNRLHLKFVKGKQKTSASIPQKEMKAFNIDEGQSNSDEEMDTQFVEDFTIEKADKIGNKQEEKKVEAKLSKKYGKGFEMLKKAGYKVGAGLGLNKQGIIDPIIAKKRKKGAGISEEEKSRKHLKEDSEEDEEMIAFKKKEDLFLGKKQKEIERKKEESKTELDEFEKLIEKWRKDRLAFLNDADILGVGLTHSHNKSNKISEFYDKINYTSDDTDITKSVLKNRQINARRILNFIPDDNGGIEKARELIVSLMKMAKEQAKHHLLQLKLTDDTGVYFNFQSDTLSKEISNIHNKKVRKENFLKQLETLNHKINPILEEQLGMFDYMEFIDYFLELYENNREQYKDYKQLTYYCIGKVIEKMKLQFKLEDYFKQRKKIIPILNSVKRLVDKTLADSEDDYNFPIPDDYQHIFAKRKNNNTNENLNQDVYDQSKENKVFCYFLNQIVIEELVNYIINIWNVKEYDKLIDMMKEYQKIIPNNMQDYIYDTALIPRLKEYVKENWTPLPNTENIPQHNFLIHLWIHPWLEVIKYDKLAEIFTIIHEKIERHILKWDISNLEVNSNLIEMIKPWKNIWGDKQFEDFMGKYIVPKLSYLISKVEINPKNQSLVQIKILIAYVHNNLLPLDKCVPILSKHFFPKWLDALQNWLTQSEITQQKFNEIQTWYEGWKKYFTKYVLFDSEEIKSQFKNALMLIYKYSNN